MSYEKRQLPDWLDAYLAFTENTEPPELYKIWCGIGAIAACLQRKCYLEWRGHVYPNMYIVLVGPAACRKGTAMSPVLSFLQQIGIKMSAEAVTREALIRELMNSCVTITDQEEQIIDEHASLTIFSPELSVFLGQNNWQLISELTDWWDCKDIWTYRTKNMGTDVINGVWVNILGATTPDYLRISLPQDAIGGGLASRIIFVWGDQKSKLVPLPFYTEEEAKLGEALLSDLFSINQLYGEFRKTNEYLELYESWYKKTEENPPFDMPDLEGYNGRRSVHLRKLSIILCASRTSDMLVTAVDLQRAITLLEHTEKYMPLVFSGRGRADLSDILEEIVRDLAVKGTLQASRILKKYMRDMTAMDLDRMIQTLVQAEIATVKAQGRDKILVYTGRTN